MPVTIEIHREQYQVAAGQPLKAALESIGISTETHMALRDGVVLAESDILQEGDVIRLVPVISGG